MWPTWLQIIYSIKKLLVETSEKNQTNQPTIANKWLCEQNPKAQQPARGPGGPAPRGAALTELGDREALHALPDLQVPLGGGIKQAIKTKPKARGEGRGRKVRTVAMHRLAFTESEQQAILPHN